MTYQVRVVQISEDIEEEVVVEVDGLLLVCFASVCPYAITPGRSYPASFGLWSADGLEVHEAGSEPIGITQLGDGRHRVVGVLKGAVLDAGIQFDDELFATEYRYLDGRLVVLEVDRINLAFE